jgi:hypothetical protein
MRLLSCSLVRSTVLCSPVVATLAALVLLAGNARAVGDVVPAAATTTATEVVAAPAAVSPAATTEAEAKERDADAAARRRALLLLILNASGHPFGFFR